MQLTDRKTAADAAKAQLDAVQSDATAAALARNPEGMLGSAHLLPRAAEAHASALQRFIDVSRVLSRAFHPKAIDYLAWVGPMPPGGRQRGHEWARCSNERWNPLQHLSVTHVSVLPASVSSYEDGTSAAASPGRRRRSSGRGGAEVWGPTVLVLTAAGEAYIGVRHDHPMLDVQVGLTPQLGRRLSRYLPLQLAVQRGRMGAGWRIRQAAMGRFTIAVVCDNGTLVCLLLGSVEALGGESSSPPTPFPVGDIPPGSVAAVCCHAHGESAWFAALLSEGSVVVWQDSDKGGCVASRVHRADPDGVRMTSIGFAGGILWALSAEGWLFSSMLSPDGSSWGEFGRVLVRVAPLLDSRAVGSLFPITRLDGDTDAIALIEQRPSGRGRILLALLGAVEDGSDCVRSSLSRLEPGEELSRASFAADWDMLDESMDPPAVWRLDCDLLMAEEAVTRFRHVSGGWNRVAGVTECGEAWYWVWPTKKPTHLDAAAADDDSDDDDDDDDDGIGASGGDPTRIVPRDSCRFDSCCVLPELDAAAVGLEEEDDDEPTTATTARAEPLSPYPRLLLLQRPRSLGVADSEQSVGHGAEKAGEIEAAEESEPATPPKGDSVDPWGRWIQSVRLTLRTRGTQWIQRAVATGSRDKSPPSLWSLLSPEEAAALLQQARKAFTLSPLNAKRRSQAWLLLLGLSSRVLEGSRQELSMAHGDEGSGPEQYGGRFQLSKDTFEMALVEASRAVTTAQQHRKVHTGGQLRPEERALHVVWHGGSPSRRLDTRESERVDESVDEGGQGGYVENVAAAAALSLHRQRLASVALPERGESSVMERSRTMSSIPVDHAFVSLELAEAVRSMLPSETRPSLPRLASAPVLTTEHAIDLPDEALEHLLVERTTRPQPPAAVTPPTAPSAISRSLGTLAADMIRTFPATGLFHCPGTALFERVKQAVLALAIWDERTGYIQGMTYLAAVLALEASADPSEQFEQTAYATLTGSRKPRKPVEGAPRLERYAASTFRMLATLTRQPLLLRFLRVEPEAIASYAAIFDDALRRSDPALADKLMEAGASAELFLFGWCQPLMVRSLPLQVAVLVWDGFLCFGTPFLFVSTLAVLKLLRPALMASGEDDCLAILTGGHGSSGAVGRAWAQVTEQSLAEALRHPLLQSAIAQKIEEIEAHMPKLLPPVPRGRARPSTPEPVSATEPLPEDSLSISSVVRQAQKTVLGGLF
jgi:hypothetical protein